VKALSAIIARLRDRLARTVAATALRLMRLRQSSILRGRRWLRAASRCATTVCGLVLFAWLTLGVQLPLDDRRFLLPLYFGAATLIGTMVVLAVNLSLIPIQRAAERYASSALRIFREDRLTSALIVVLACSSLLLFAVGVHGFLAGPSHGWAGIPVAVMAAAFDLMRWHHRRTTRLLDPSEAITRLAAQVTAGIDKRQRLIARLARHSWRLMPDQDRAQHSTEALESSFYLEARNHAAAVVFWVSDLAEIASKALDRGDDLATRQATSAIATVAGHYLERRKNNLVLQAADFHTLGSDGFGVLEPALARLKELVVRAASKKNEVVAIAALQSLTELTAATAALDGKPFEARPGALTWLPLGYTCESIKISQRAGLADAALEGSRSLLSLAERLPEKARITEAHLAWISTEESFPNSRRSKGRSGGQA